MMIERDPDFWRAVASDPAVYPHVALGQPGFDIGGVISHPRVIPLASENGGYLFFGLDCLGFVYEMHALFTPDGWGKEASATLKAALDRMFFGGAQVVIVQEVEGNWRSSPPKSFGWKQAGDFANGFRAWVLTMNDWHNSPARRREQRKCLQS